ncbi:kinase-like protein [Halteromyces radiatus]|uniref:kinase-like protein n=1 Tax=Halteromyces radiatus TaxID=101107 RepID=UPI0022205171|nr:kinase-like protein [Halteromyces radiatus]KAI8078777.1 kinase-like protein [Halteromyces radiatus]
MIGYGGSSQVYRVFHKESKEILALKHVTTKRLSKQTYHDYRNEITFLVKLRQKNCLHIPYLQNYENNRIAGHLDIVLELGEIDFAHYMFLQRSKPLDYNFVRWYGQLMLEAVDEIHDRHVVHRDLKPANFILKEGSLKLIDFGISKKVDAQGYVEIDSPIGTVHYMPPEAFLFVEKDGRKYIQIGQFSDVWALGCIFYQMIYGKTPFHNVDADHKALYICDPSFIIDYPSSVSFDPPSGTSVVVPVKQDVISLLQACLDRDPQNRWSVKRLLKHPFFHPEHSL